MELNDEIKKQNQNFTKRLIVRNQKNINHIQRKKKIERLLWKFRGLDIESEEESEKRKKKKVICAKLDICSWQTLFKDEGAAETLQTPL